VSVEQAARPPLPFQLLVPHPFSLSTGVATGSRPHSLRRRRSWRTGGRGGAGAEAWRRGGEEADWSGCRRKESGAGTQATRNRHCGQLRRHRALPRLPRPECSCRAGFLRWVAEAAAVAVVVSTRPPSQGFIPAPLPRCPASGAVRQRGFGLDTCWRQGGAGSARGGSRDRRPSPTTALDSAGATALARRRCTPEHDCGVAEAAPLVLHASTLRRGRAAAVAAARWRLRSPLASAPCHTFGGSLLPPHALCGGIWVTFAVPLRCRLPPYPPPIRLAASAMRRSPDRPGHSFPSNPTTPCRTPHPATNTLALIDETHVRDIETQPSMQRDA